MQVTLYSNFSKRENSTKQPTSIVGITKDLKLKDSCSRIRPSFFIADVRDFTYLQAWGNYYFIRNSAFDINGAQYIDCELDYLATWKAQINNTSAFVKYSSSNYSSNVNDDRIAQEVTNTYDYHTETSMFTSENRTVIVSIGTDLGACIYAFTVYNFIEFCGELMDENNNLFDSLIKQYSNVSNAILYARELPISYSDFDETETTIVIGNYTFTRARAKIIAPKINAGSTTSMGKHLTELVEMPIPWIYNDFRRNRNYTKLNLFLPFLGVVEVDTKSVIGFNSFYIRMVLNVLTGSINYILSTDEGRFATFTGECGRLLPVSSNMQNAIGVVNNAINMTAGLLTANLGNPVAGFSSYLSNAVGATWNAHRDNISTIGGYGGSYGEQFVANYMIMCIATNCRTEPSELTTLYGRPCFKVLPISSLSGYVETSGFSIELDTYTDARNIINRLMDTGVYLE